MDNKQVMKIRYDEQAVLQRIFDQKLNETKKYWEKYFEEHEDVYPNKKLKTSKSFAKWCVDTNNCDLLVDWEKYNDYDPSQVGSNCTKTANIYCKKDHTYSAKISDITHDSRCPYCSGHAILEGFNDLATLRPDLAAEWDYERNEKKPYEYTTGTHQKVWWVCPRGHSYQANIYDRTSKNRTCLICRDESLLLSNNSEIDQPKATSEDLTLTEKQRLTKEYWENYFNTHSDSYPRQRHNSQSFAKWCVDSGNTNLLVDWDKNNDFNPAKIGRSVRKKITILCENGHLHDTMPNYITDGYKCPF